MGTVVQLRNQINNSYYQLKDSVDEKLVLVEEKIKSKLLSEVDLVQKMTEYHIDTGGKRLRALLTLGSAKLCGYTKGGRDINLAACVEMIHGATLMHDDVIDLGNIRRGKKTLNSIWGNHSSVLIGDYLLSRCFEMMVEDGNLEVLKLLSSTSSKIAQGEVLQLQHKGEVDMLEETYLKIISAKTAELFAAATKVGAILSDVDSKEKDALEFYGRNLGLTFQIADDTLDYNSDLKLFGKISYTRYVNLLSISYSPIFFKNFYLTANRAFTIPTQEKPSTKLTNYYLLSLKPLFRNTYEDNSFPIDQVLSGAAKYVFPKEHAEVYFEYGWNDGSSNSRDLILDMSHSAASIYGLKKIQHLSNNFYLNFEAEATQMSQRPSYLQRNAGNWYVHSNGGYINENQIFKSILIWVSMKSA